MLTNVWRHTIVQSVSARHPSALQMGQERQNPRVETPGRLTVYSDASVLGAPASAGVGLVIRQRDDQGMCGVQIPAQGAIHRGERAAQGPGALKSTFWGGM